MNDATALQKCGNVEYKLIDTVNKLSTVYETHCHAEDELIVVLQGSITLAIENKQYFLSPGSAAFIPATAYHSVVGQDSERYTRFTALNLAGALPPDALNSLRVKCRGNAVRKSDFIREIGKRLALAIKQNDADFWVINAINTLLFEFLSADKDCLQEVWTDSDDNLYRIMAYINSHIDEMLTLSNVASAVYLSKSTVSHLFKKKIKVSVKQYILQKKFAYAKSLISGGMPAMEVAKRIGYLNYANFYTQYKKILGASPTDDKSGQ